MGRWAKNDIQSVAKRNYANDLQAIYRESSGGVEANIQGLFACLPISGGQNLTDS